MKTTDPLTAENGLRTPLINQRINALKTIGSTMEMALVMNSLVMIE